MNEEKLENMLGELGDALAEPVNPALAENIKQNIPYKLPHRTGLDTISIIIDLRVSRIAAAAAIVITCVLFLALFGGRDSKGGGIIEELKYALAGGLGKEWLSARVPEFYNYLVQQGREVTYYGDSINRDDKDAILMYWKQSDGTYRVVFADFRLKTVSAEELIGLQSQMLRKKGR
jgi:hypothetical protein